MITNHYFLTGTSRGIGKAMAEALLSEPGNQVTGLSRSNTISHERFTHVPLDLSDLQQVREWKFPQLPSAKKIVLVNNAGMIGDVKYAGRMSEDDIVRTYNVNLVAPSLLVNSFLRSYSEQPAEQVILNVSSGAAKNPIDGWSIYCATKAGLDHFSRTVAEELKQAGKTQVHLFSVAPGVVDTSMQEQIRSSSDADFSRLEQFIDYKKSDQLLSPSLVASKYLAILGFPKNYGEIVFSLRDIPPTSK